MSRRKKAVIATLHKCIFKNLLDNVPGLVHLETVKINALLSVKFFKTESGSEPVRDWLLEDLNEEERKVVGRDIKIIQMCWPIGMPLVKSMGSGLWEVRSNLENKLARVLFTFHNNEIILLHGFVKKSQKTLKKDLELAKQRKSLFKKG